MKLFIPFAVLLAATASANPIATQQEASEAAELDKRDNVSVTICKNVNYTGDCTTVKVGSGTCCKPPKSPSVSQAMLTGTLPRYPGPPRTLVLQRPDQLFPCFGWRVRLL